ncbi:MAG: hypothetical protein QW450_04955, partial [Candidatus Nitrosocaldus sp.]
YFTHVRGSKDKVYDICREELYGIMQNYGKDSADGLGYTYTFNIAGMRIVREVGPRVYQVVADITVRKS